MLKKGCYDCKYRKEFPGSTYSRCTNKNAKVEGNSYGIKNGWFDHPYNFDPVWLEECDGFEAVQKC